LLTSGRNMANKTIQRRYSARKTALMRLKKEKQSNDEYSGK
jgi:hypothetical protein